MLTGLNDDSAEGEPVMSVIDGNKPGSDDGDDGDDTLRRHLVVDAPRCEW